MRALFSLEDLPPFEERSLKSLCDENAIPLLSARAALRARPDVVVVADPFTAAYEAHGLIALARLARSLGFSAGILKPYVNGKLMSVRGARRMFVRYASRQAGRLQALSNAGMALMGYDPALTICYRDEYQDLLGPSRGDFNVLLPEEWLATALATERARKALSALSGALEKASGNEEFSGAWYLFCHCTEAALLPKSVQDWQSVMAAFGLTLIPVPVACCGMAGLHGHMSGNLEESRRVYEQNWKWRLHERPMERCLATGYSCRSQVERMEGRPLMHPVMVLERLMEEASGGKAS